MTEQDFLNDILADPLDDGPRLVFADWLSDHGDPRGEFIQVQCELAADDEQRFGGLERRERKLLELHGAQWNKPVWRLGCTHLRYHRGFVHQLTTLPETLSRNDTSILKMAPLLNALEIQCVYPEVLELWRACVHATTLSRVDTLMLRDSHFRSQPTDETEILDLLLGAADHVQFHTFVLNRLYLSGDDIQPFVYRGHELTKLRRLHLGGNHLHDEHAESLIESRLFKQLDLLDLRWNFLTEMMREQLRDRFGNRVLA